MNSQDQETRRPKVGPSKWKQIRDAGGFGAAVQSSTGLEQLVAHGRPELGRQAREWDDAKLLRMTDELFRWYRELDAEGARRGFWTAMDAPEEWGATALPDAMDLQELDGVELEQWISDLGDALRLARDEADAREAGDED